MFEPPACFIYLQDVDSYFVPRGHCGYCQSSSDLQYGRPSVWQTFSVAVIYPIITGVELVCKWGGTILNIVDTL